MSDEELNRRITALEVALSKLTHKVTAMEAKLGLGVFLGTALGAFAARALGL